MTHDILTVCTANICRSPVAEAYLRDACPHLTVGSAGVQALVGRGADSEAAKAAESFGISVSDHKARQFDDTLGRAAQVILVMDHSHRSEILRRWPHFLGKTFLLGQFMGGQEIPDPYRRGQAMHMRSAELIVKTAETWVTHLAGLKS